MMLLPTSFDNRLAKQPQADFFIKHANVGALQRK